MRHLLLSVAVLLLMVARVCAKETHVSLEDYVTRAEAITICVVDKDNGDGTVTVRITEVLKGTLGQSEVIRGETGHCVVRGPVSRFMKPQHTYLVFLFPNNTVGRLGGILEIEEESTLLITSIQGFTETSFDKKTHRHTLPIDHAKQQIRTLLEKSRK